jgi:hypothetical protein
MIYVFVTIFFLLACYILATAVTFILDVIYVYRNATFSKEVSRRYRLNQAIRNVFSVFRLL